MNYDLKKKLNETHYDYSIIKTHSWLSFNSRCLALIWNSIVKPDEALSTVNKKNKIQKKSRIVESFIAVIRLH